jgi:glycosyltransferase involved in cell wall biosynthesis
VIKQKPLISVIVSTYNSEKFIRGKIVDLLEQTIADQLEIIIVNSGSKQNEDKIIKEFLSHPNIIYITTEERETIYKAWNRGIKISHGLFITNANTDDRLRKDALKILSSTLMDNPKIALVYADQYLADIPNIGFEEITKNDGAKLYPFPDYNYFHQLDRCLVCSQPMWRASLHFEDNIWFEDRYEILGDHDFVLKITHQYPILHIPEPLGIFYLSPTKENKSRGDTRRVRWEREQICEPYIVKVIQDGKSEDLNKILKEFRKDVWLPIPFLYLWKRFCLFVNPKLIKDRFFYSIEFIYYFTISVLEKENIKDDAIRLSKKFLRYGKSGRIQERLKVLSSESPKSAQ